MIILITGASHTGKTLLAQRILEEYKMPYFSIDHLKMGLIRSKNTSLTPLSDDRDLTAYLWPIVREIIKTAIENKQNLVVEGCYIPFDWQNDFDEEYLNQISYLCLIMSENYIRNHVEDIKRYSSVIESRLDDSECTEENLLLDNAFYYKSVKKYKLNFLYIDKFYDVQSEGLKNLFFRREKGVVYESNN